MITKNIAVLLTCYNRKEYTLSCLNALYLNKNEEVKVDVFLVDDGSTDGTSEAISYMFPDVKIIKGTGSLFWNQGMRLAWQTAINTKLDFDFYIWLNDDTEITNNAINHLLACYSDYKEMNRISCIVVAACRENQTSNMFSYGLRSESEEVIVPNEDNIKGKLMNGNLVLIPKEIFMKLGIHSNDYTHGMGDYDYGLRAIEAGFSLITTKEYIAICPTNKGIPTWCNPNIKLKKRMKAFYSPLGLNIKEYVVFRKKFWPKNYRSFIFKAYLKCVFPSIYSILSKK